MPASPGPDGKASGLVDGSFLATLLPVCFWAPAGADSQEERGERDRNRKQPLLVKRTSIL